MGDSSDEAPRCNRMSPQAVAGGTPCQPLVGLACALLGEAIVCSVMIDFMEGIPLTAPSTISPDARASTVVLECTTRMRNSP